MKVYTFLIFLLSLSLFGCCSKAFAQKEDWQTYYEKSGYLKTPDYKETVEFCKRLDNASEMVTYTTFGKSAQGRELPLLIIDKQGYNKSRDVAQTNKVVILIQAGIHAGEIDGKDATLMLIRDMVIDKKNMNLLDNATLLIVPIFNVDGHENSGKYKRINQKGPEEMGFRTTATNLNLNRDYLKMDAPEMRAWHSLFIDWMPDFLIDIHTTDGADYQYPITYGMEVNGNMLPALTDWQKNVFIKTVEKSMEKAGYPIFQYVAFRKWHDPRSGLRNWVSSPALSHGYLALQNRPSLLIETHMLKDYKTRVSATYEMLVQSVSVINKEAMKLRLMINEAERYCASATFRQTEFPLSFETASDSIIVDFKGYHYDVVKSDLTGGDWFVYNNKKPVTMKIPYFNQQKAVEKVKLPEAYIIPAEWQEVIDRLDYFGIEYSRLKKETELTASCYRFKNVKLSPVSYEGRQNVISFEQYESNETVKLPAGSAIIRMNQPSAAIIPHILEPKAPSSYFSWGFFNTIFEQKEYGESYVLEALAREMLKDPKVKEAYEKVLKDDPAMKNNQPEILNWFYKNSPYYDIRLNRYPVIKIYDERQLELFE